ncbi:MAG: hypothetical protein V3V04_00765, partial [Rhizobiaceae bacterium]
VSGVWMESGTINNAGAEPVGDAVILFKALLAMPMGSAVPNWGLIDVHSSGACRGEGFCLGDFGASVCLHACLFAHRAGLLRNPPAWARRISAGSLLAHERFLLGRFLQTLN